MVITMQNWRVITMHNLERAIVLTLTVILTGCTTPYQSKGFGGGYSDSRIDSNTVRVSFYGNGFTGKESVENDMLYRCSEVTIQDGYDYFVIVTGGTSPVDSSFTTPGTYTQNTTYNYGSSYTSGTYQPGQTVNVRKFESSVMIKMFSGKKPAGLLNAYDARELIKYMKPQVNPDAASQ
jgi:hypothetical protein